MQEENIEIKNTKTTVKLSVSQFKTFFLNM